jgi:hypothetical protein
LTGATNIKGPGIDLLAISGGNAVGVLEVLAGATVSIQDLTITNGRRFNTGNGGGVINAGVLSLTRVAVKNSSALSSFTAYGGGIYSFGNLTLTDCTIAGNQATSGGGGVFQQGSSVQLTITGSTISGNTAGQSGGGVYTVSPTSITNSTLSGNTAGDSGGLASFFGTSISISSSTITRNTNTGSFGGTGVSVSGTVVTIMNSIVADNVDNSGKADVSGAFTSQGFNLIGNAGSATGFTHPSDQVGPVAGLAGGASLPLNPMLGPLQDNGGTTKTHALLAGSPAIDKGNAFGLTVDQRGGPRTVDFASIINANGGDGTDIGSFEVLSPTAAPASITGRVATASGEPIRGASVTIVGGGLAAPRTVTTGTFGYYSFGDLETGTTYVITVNARRYYFAVPSRVVTLTDNAVGVDFVAETP